MLSPPTVSIVRKFTVLRTPYADVLRYNTTNMDRPSPWRGLALLCFLKHALTGFFSFLYAPYYSKRHFFSCSKDRNSHQRSNISRITFLFGVESQDAPLYRHPTLVERNYLNMLVFAIPQKASVFWSFYGPFG